MCIIALPDEVVGVIVGMANDIVEHETLKKKWSGRIMKELKRTVATELWSDLDDAYCAYEHAVREWRVNSRYFDPVYTEEVVENLYSMYAENRQLLIDEIYNPCRFSTYDCPCSREHHLRSNLDQMVVVQGRCGLRIYGGTCSCGNCGYDDMVCNMMYALEHRLLWNKNW